MHWLKRRWFLVGLVLLIPLGVALGSQLPAQRLQRASAWVEAGATSWLVAAILFLMSFSLDSRQLGRSIRRPGPVMFACLVNYGLVPLLAWPLMPLQQLDDFALGLMITVTVPSTMAAASIWTRKAHGNEWNRLDAYSLEFHQRVRQGYHLLAESEPERWVTIEEVERAAPWV